MASSFRQRPPIWFWAIAIVLLLWGAAGVFACVQQFRLGAEAMGPADEYQRALYASLPAWYNWVYAVATGAGLIGTVALLMRSGSAKLLYIVSLVAVVIQFGWVFGATDLIAVRGAAATVPFPIFIFAVGVFQIWFAGYAARRGWIS